MEEDKYLIGHAGEARAFGRRRVAGSEESESRYASDNAAMEEMDNLFRQSSRTDLKEMVQQQNEVGTTKRFSEDDFQGHYRNSEYARTHEPLRPVSGSKKKKKSSAAELTRPARWGDADGVLTEESETAATAHTVQESAGNIEAGQDSSSSSSSSSSEDEDGDNDANTTRLKKPAEQPPLTYSTETPVVDARAALATDPLSQENRVQFHVGVEEADDDEIAGDGHKKRHHHHHHHHRQARVEDPAARLQPGSERIPQRIAEDGDLIDENISSHRYDAGPRRHKVKRKDDKTISHVVHLGDVNSGHTLLLGKRSVDHTPHDMFVELDELTAVQDDLEWKETARWIKYEEDVEQEGNRWGKPHLASLSFHSLMCLRRCLEKGAMLLDVEDCDSVAISHRIASQLVKDDMIRQSDFGAVMRTLLLRRQHVGDHHHSSSRALRGYVGTRNMSKAKLQSLADMRNNSHTSLGDDNDKEKKKSPNLQNSRLRNSIGGESTSSDVELRRFMSHHNILRRVTAGTEVFSVNVGHVDFVSRPTAAFVRLYQGTFLPGITEVPLPVRFIFFLVAPSDCDENVHETGRAFATIMSSPVFHEAAYKATSRMDLMWGFKEFLDETLVLPPISWTNPDVLDVHELQRKSNELQQRRIERQARQLELEAAAVAAKDKESEQQDKVAPDTHPKSSKNSKKTAAAGTGGEDGDDGDGGDEDDDPLVRVGRPFAGLVRDINRRYPFYVSDFRDGLNPSVFSAAFFIFFAALAGAITFGGLMMDKTELQIGISETLISTSIVGVVFSLFSCQPLIIVGTTGPVLLFDEALFRFAQSNDLEFLPMRVWIAFWMLVVSLVVVGLEGSVFVKKFTRFTTEIFSSLVSILFVYEALSKLATVFADHRLMADYCSDELYMQSLPLIHQLNDHSMGTDNNSSVSPANSSATIPTNSSSSSSTDAAPLNQPNTAYLSMLLMFGTFFIANYLRQFRNSKFLGRRVRRMLGDFGVPIAILLMVAVDQLMPMVYTQRLLVPSGLTPSDPQLRGWFISPMGLHRPVSWFAVLGALPAAGLIFIVIYMETMVCQLIMAKPERNLRKGTGFHWDIVLLSVLNLMTSLIGAPWMCAATIRSVSHAAALTVTSATYAPGESPKVVGVHEQRLSTLAVSILIGLSVVLSFVLKQIPIAVVFGIFMYMGISSMIGVQLLERCVLFLKPVKHHPDVDYVHKVRTWRMHLFTLIQLACLAFLLGIKFTPAAIGFPFFLAMLIPLRLRLLPRVFSSREIVALDGGEEARGEDDADFYEEAHRMPTAMSLGNFYSNFSMSMMKGDRHPSHRV